MTLGEKEDMESVRIAVCIATFKRPAGLARLLEGLENQVFDAHAPDLKIVVADNDVEGSAKSVCERFKLESKWPIAYCIQPQRGIAPTRNEAVRVAGTDVDWIAFIDDDEVPDTRWLENLLLVQQAYDADVVYGPVMPEFSDKVPAWIEKGRFFYRKRHSTGQRLNYANTGNVIFKAKIVKDFEPPFDTRFALSGGEDRHFFQRVTRHKYKIVWADEAVVYESIPPDRTTARWLIKRWFRVGNTASLVDRDITPSFYMLQKRLCKGILSILYGLVLIPAGIILGKRGFIKAILFVVYGLGMLAGLLGYVYKPYRNSKDHHEMQAKGGK